MSMTIEQLETMVRRLEKKVSMLALFGRKASEVPLEQRLQVEGVERPKQAADWQPLPKMAHPEVLNALMQRIQEFSGILTTELTAVDQLDKILASHLILSNEHRKASQRPDLPDGIHFVLRTADKILGDLGDMPNAEPVQATIERAVDILAELRSDVTVLKAETEKCDDILLGILRNVSRKKELQSSVDKFASELRSLHQRVEGASVEAQVHIDLRWDMTGEANPDAKEQAKKQLNLAVGQAIEFVLMNVLNDKEGRGFDQLLVRKLSDEGFRRFVESVLNQYHHCFNDATRGAATRIARGSILNYFGFVSTF